MVKLGFFYMSIESTLKENLDIIHDSIQYLKKWMKSSSMQSIFDGYKRIKICSEAIETAMDAGAILWFCDTNGEHFPGR
jgi:hypothetical protein